MANEWNGSGEAFPSEPIAYAVREFNEVLATLRHEIERADTHERARWLWRLTSDLESQTMALSNFAGERAGKL